MIQEVLQNVRVLAPGPHALGERAQIIMNFSDLYA